jgi:hypothetical protein
MNGCFRRRQKNLLGRYSERKESAADLLERVNQKAIQSNDPSFHTVCGLVSDTTRCPEDNSCTDKANNRSDSIPLIRVMAFHSP